MRRSSASTSTSNNGRPNKKATKAAQKLLAQRLVGDCLEFNTSLTRGAAPADYVPIVLNLEEPPIPPGWTGTLPTTWVNSPDGIRLTNDTHISAGSAGRHVIPAICVALGQSKLDEDAYILAATYKLLKITDLLRLCARDFVTVKGWHYSTIPARAVQEWCRGGGRLFLQGFITSAAKAPAAGPVITPLSRQRLNLGGLAMQEDSEPLDSPAMTKPAAAA